MSRLITSSLVGAIDWYESCYESQKDKALRDLERQLARDYSEPPGLSLRRGIEFEDMVYAYARRQTDKGSDHFKWFVAECKGGVFQKKVKKFVKLDGIEYCLYGKLDVWFPTVIKDIKTTGRWKGDKNYLDTFQHWLYCYLADIGHFEYLVAVFDGVDEENKRVKEHHKVDFWAPNKADVETVIMATVEKVAKFMADRKELFELYTTKFSLY